MKVINYDKFNKMVQTLKEWMEDNLIGADPATILELVEMLIFLTEEDINE